MVGFQYLCQNCKPTFRKGVYFEGKTFLILGDMSFLFERALLYRMKMSPLIKLVENLQGISILLNRSPVNTHRRNNVAPYCETLSPYPTYSKFEKVHFITC